MLDKNNHKNTNNMNQKKQSSNNQPNLYQAYKNTFEPLPKHIKSPSKTPQTPCKTPPKPL